MRSGRQTVAHGLECELRGIAFDVWKEAAYCKRVNKSATACDVDPSREVNWSTAPAPAFNQEPAQQVNNVQYIHKVAQCPTDDILVAPANRHRPWS
jgi:hypothetical protein